jgi:RNA polymerase sigma factor (TIGR02999 family)
MKGVAPRSALSAHRAEQRVQSFRPSLEVIMFAQLRSIRRVADGPGRRLPWGSGLAADIADLAFSPELRDVRRMDARPTAPGDAAREITDLLIELREGRRDAMDRLMPLVYDELKRIAHAQLGGERAGHTLDTTAAVHEVYLRLVGLERIDWRDRAHFFAVAAGAMRRVLIDYARHYRASKRGGGARLITFDDVAAADDRADTLVALDDALTRLAEHDPRLARVVECRFFGGLTEAETAEALGVTDRTVRRDWVKAKAWLHQAMTS